MGKYPSMKKPGGNGGHPKFFRQKGMIGNAIHETIDIYKFEIISNEQRGALKSLLISSESCNIDYLFLNNSFNLFYFRITHTLDTNNFNFYFRNQSQTISYFFEELVNQDAKLRVITLNGPTQVSGIEEYECKLKSCTRKTNFLSTRQKIHSRPPVY